MLAGCQDFSCKFCLKTSDMYTDQQRNGPEKHFSDVMVMNSTWCIDYVEGITLLHENKNIEAFGE